MAPIEVALTSRHGGASIRPVLGRIASWVSALAALAFLVGITWLGRLERGGPPHVELVLEGGVPATLYVPGPDGAGLGAFLDPPPRDERPPGVVQMHGFASSRAFGSTLARHLARAGYAVLSIDARGHGANRNAFQPGRGRPDAFEADLAAAVDFLRASPFVDGSRLAVMGHSMGAGAALDYATRDSGIDAAILLAGGWTLQGPYRPPNALFVFAAGDVAAIIERSLALAAELAGVEAVEEGRVYGDPEAGTAVRALRVPHTDHASVAWSATTAGEIVEWLDAVHGRRSPPLEADPRLAVAAGLLCLAVLVLPGLGLLVGRLVPEQAPLPAERRPLALAALAAALAAALPLFPAGSALPALPVEVGDQVFPRLGVAGVGLLVLLALTRGDPRPMFFGWPRAAAGAAVALVALYVLLQPLAVVVGGLVPTPQRAWIFALSTGVLLPFSLAFQALLRRGAPVPATAFALAGRVVVLAALLAGVTAGWLDGVVILILPSLALVFLLSEIVGSCVYAASRNLTAIACIDASWLALVIASSMPIRI